MLGGKKLYKNINKKREFLEEKERKEVVRRKEQKLDKEMSLIIFL